MGMPKLASYLSSLPVAEYGGVSNPVTSIINYFIDSYFHKIDQRALQMIEEPVIDPNIYVKETWLGCEIHTALSLNQSFPAYARSLNAYAFVKLFESEYEIVPVIDKSQFKDTLKYREEYQIQYQQLNISLTEILTLPVFGTFFIRNKVTDVHLIISFDICHYTRACNFTILVNPEFQLDATKFISDLAASMKKHDIYRNKCLTFNKGYLDFYQVKPTTWDQIILKDHLKQQIRENTIGVLQNLEELASIGMSPSQSTLLISPPGMAKTTIFRATTHELDGEVTCMWCTGKSIDYAEDVTSLFQAVRNLAPCILFIEDMDLFGGDRNLLGRDSHVLNEFLAQLDGTQNNAGVVIMASTNDADSMDEALINRPGRFGIKIEIQYPDAEDRQAMLVKFLKEFNAHPAESVSKDSWDSIIRLTNGFSGDYVKALAKAAVIKAVAEGRCVDQQVLFTIDDLNVAGEQMVKNYQIGQKAKKHINQSEEIGVFASFP